MVEVQRPPLVFGYYTSTTNLFSLGHEDEKNKSGVNPNIPTFVSVSISLDPLISIPSENELEYYPGFEDMQLLLAGTKWVKDM